MRVLSLFAFAAALTACATRPAVSPVVVTDVPSVASTDAEMWLSTADGTLRIAPQPALTAVTDLALAPVVTIDSERRFQRMQGFGASITDASAELLSALPDAKRAALMRELFSRENGGLGLSFARLTVGASDFSSRHYSYDDSPGNAPDPELTHFSIEPAARHVLPVTRQALAINPELMVMISPWSAPAWMKTSRSLITGRLEPRYYPAFAAYMARTVQAFEREGVPIAMLTIQNEPDFEPDSYPGMRMSPEDRAAVVGKHLGPLFDRLGIKTQILDWDHNWDKPEMPMGVLKDPVARRYIAGVAWHCYGGDVPAQSQVRDAYPDKDVWFTECSGGEWAPKYGETLGWMTEKLIIGAANHWSRGALLWNLALDPKHGPHLGGCGDCRGVVTIDPASQEITRNVEYVVLGHASRFVLPGAYRIASASNDKDVVVGAFVNPDGSRVALFHRKAGAGAIGVAIDGMSYSVPLPAGAIATVRWASRK